jgi:holo-[acyl-carrier protein] synthase
MSISRATWPSRSLLNDEFTGGLPASVIGIGVDIVDTERFASVVARTPRIVTRLFTEAESLTADGADRSAVSLAARFAAKEAVAKVLGDTQGLEWHHCEVVTDSLGKPSLRITDTIAEAALARGIASWHLSLSHDGGHAIAFVVAEGRSHA